MPPSELAYLSPRNSDSHTTLELRVALLAGARLVRYEYCISLVLITVCRPSRIHCLYEGQHGVWQGLPYSLVSLLFGWWGLPWGLWYTPHVILKNCCGGEDVTDFMRPILVTTSEEGPSGPQLL